MRHSLFRLLLLGPGVALLLFPFARADAEPGYGFTISASGTDPNVQSGPARLGVYELFLWMDISNPPLEKPGIASFDGEIRTSGDLIFVAFAPEAGWMNALGGTRLFMAVQHCPSGPMLAGKLIVRGVDSGEGSICLGRSADSGILGAVDCRKTPEVWDVRVRGFATDSLRPCCVLCRDRVDQNLEVLSFTAPATAVRGETIASSLEVVVQNSGTVDIEKPVSLAVFLSRAPRVAVLDDVLSEGRVSIDGLAAGERKRISFPGLAIPVAQELAVNFIGVLADHGDEVPEGIEDDNVAVLPIRISEDTGDDPPSSDRVGLSSVRVGNATARAGEPVRIPLQARGRGEIDSFDLAFSCPSSLELLDVERAEATNGWSGWERTSPTIGVVRIAGTGAGIALQPEGWITLAHLVIRGPEEYSALAEIAITESTREAQKLESRPGAFEVLVSIPTRFGLAPSRYNPALRSFAIEYRVPEGVSREVEIGIFDLRGNLVKSLLRGRRGPGRHGLLWDGTDRMEKPLAPGMYFVRMIGPSFQATDKLVLE